MNFKFKSRIALVTGGTKGIGAAIVSNLLSAGAHVIMTGSKHLDSLKVPDGVTYVAVDFRDITATTAFAHQIASQKIDILINNAGINRIAPISEINSQDWDDIQNVNVRAPFILTKALVPGMTERNYGRIVNISSIFGHVTRNQRASYTTSKFALNGFTKAVALDCAKRNVLVNAVAPGFVDTKLTRTILKPHEIQSLIDQVPIGRLAAPEEIAQMVLFLASDLNTFTTGQTILVDGGFTSV